MGVSIDLSKAHLSRVYGDITAVFSWMNNERALFLIPTYRRGAPWYVVMEPAAHTWSDQDASNIANVVRKGAHACEVLGIEPNPTNVRRLAGIVNDAIADLVRMPSAPLPEYHRASYGHMTMSADGKPFASEEVKIEREGVAYG